MPKGKLPPGLARWNAAHGRGQASRQPAQRQGYNSFGERVSGNLLLDNMRPNKPVQRVMSAQEIAQKAAERNVPITYGDIAQIQREQAQKQAQQLANNRGQVHYSQVAPHVQSFKRIIAGKPTPKEYGYQ